MNPHPNVELPAVKNQKSSESFRDAFIGAIRNKGPGLRGGHLTDLRGFSCPDEPFADYLFNLIVSAHAKESISRFVAQFGEEIERSGTGLGTFLSSAAQDASLLGAELWNPGICHVFRAIEGRCAASTALIAGSAALTLSASNQRGSWSVDFVEETRGLRWAHWLIPSATGLSVECDGDGAVIETRGHQAGLLKFKRAHDAWIPEADYSSLQALAMPLERISFLTSDGLLPDERANLQPFIPVAAVPPEVGHAYEVAVQLLVKHIPSWIPWFRRVLRNIALVESPGIHQMTSGSPFWSCGVMHISLCTNPFLLADTMVHEASHQYLHIAQQLGPLDDGSDARTYYSPVARAPRPLARMLLAYHAFANVALFYRALRMAGVQLDEAADRSAKEAEADVKLLSQPLIDNPALTDVGRGIFQPLSKKLGVRFA